MEALGVLAVAERDIHARTTASRRTRVDRAPLRRPRGFAPRARLALPVRRKSTLFRALTRFARQDAREMSVGTGDQTFNAETAYATYVSLVD